MPLTLVVWLARPSGFMKHLISVSIKPAAETPSQEKQSATATQSRKNSDRRSYLFGERVGAKLTDWFSQADARSSTILLNELYARLFEGQANHLQG